MQEEKKEAVAAVYRGRIRMRLLAWWGALAPAAFLLGLSLAVLVYGRMYSGGRSSATLSVFAAGSFVVVVAVSVAVLVRFVRRERLDRLTARNMHLLFPAQRKDLEVWLSTGLSGSYSDAARVVTEERLNEALPHPWRTRLTEKPKRTCVVMAAAMGVLAVALCFQEGSFMAQYGRYLGRVACWMRPLKVAIARFSPAGNWVGRGRPFDVEILFDRPPKGEVRLGVTAGSDTEELDMTAASPRLFTVTVPGQAMDFALQVRGNGQKFRSRTFRVYPYEGVGLELVGIQDQSGRLMRVASPAEFPLTVSSDTRLVFSVLRARCPISVFGLGSDIHGDVVLKKGKVALRSYGRAKVDRDDRFRLYWQYPEYAVETSRPYAVRCIENDRPEARLLNPTNGMVVTKVPKEWEIVGVGTDSDGIAKAFLHCTDYHGMDVRIEMKLERDEEGRTVATVKLPSGFLATRQGDKLGFCMEMVDESEAREASFSPVTDVSVPPAPEREGAKTRDGDRVADRRPEGEGRQDGAERRGTWDESGMIEDMEAFLTEMDTLRDEMVDASRAGEPESDWKPGERAKWEQAMREALARMAGKMAGMRPGRMGPMPEGMPMAGEMGEIGDLGDVMWVTNRMAFCTNRCSTCSNKCGSCTCGRPGGRCGKCGTAARAGMLVAEMKRGSGTGSGTAPGGGSGRGRGTVKDAAGLDGVKPGDPRGGGSGAEPHKDEGDPPPAVAVNLSRGSKDRRVTARKGAEDRERYVLRDRLVMPENRDMEKEPGTRRATGPAPGAGAPLPGARGQWVRPRNLSPSEMEKLILKHRDIAESLTPAERRIVDDYYRRLRDIN